MKYIKANSRQYPFEEIMVKSFEIGEEVEFNGKQNTCVDSSPLGFELGHVTLSDKSGNQFVVWGNHCNCQ